MHYCRTFNKYPTTSCEYDEMIIDKLIKYLCTDKCPFDNIKKRHCLLKIIVGSETYKEIAHVVYDIKLIRSTRLL